MGSYYVYILTNKTKTVLYTGMTNNLERRFAERKSGQISGFSQKYKVDSLVYCQVFDRPIDAIKAEKRIKGWTRQKKNDLINSANPDWNDLSLHSRDSSLHSE